jgi:hypothetical protein
MLGETCLWGIWTLVGCMKHPRFTNQDPIDYFILITFSCIMVFLVRETDHPWEGFSL